MEQTAMPWYGAGRDYGGRMESTEERSAGAVDALATYQQCNTCPHLKSCPCEPVCCALCVRLYGWIGSQ